MAMINIVNLTFYYDGSYKPVFEDVSFQIDTDWKLGFTGRNGRGKTTFLKLLLGQYEYQGSISSPVSFDYFPFSIENPKENTLDIVEAIHPNFELWELHKELSLLEVDAEVLYRAYETLSEGEQIKVLLASMFLKQNNFLLIDEPTNHLDVEARKKIAAYLNTKKGFILVSHDRLFLDTCIDHILSVNKTDIEIQKGNFSSWQHNKDLTDYFELVENENIKKDIRQMENIQKRTKNWSEKAHRESTKKDDSGVTMGAKEWKRMKAKKMDKQIKSIEKRRQKAVEEKGTLLRNIEKAEKLILSPLEYTKNRLIEVKNLSISYGETIVLEKIDFEICEGDRLVINGKNGSGKSSILKILAGEKIPFSGEVNIGTNLKISYVPQDISFLQGSLSDWAEQKEIDESQFKTILRKLDFAREQFDWKMEDYSDGQKKKVLLATSFCEEAHLYIWDEPLNYVDVLSRIQIENLILEYKPTMIFVEHDISFSEKIANRTLVL